MVCMGRRGRTVSVAVMMGIIVVLMENTNSTKLERDYFDIYTNMIPDDRLGNNKILPDIITKTDKLKKEEYDAFGKYAFIKDLSWKNERSPNKTDLIVARHANMHPLTTAWIFNCSYVEVKENKKIRKKCISYFDVQNKEKKSILVVLAGVHNLPSTMNQINKAVEHSKNPKIISKIKLAVDSMRLILNRMIVMSYIEDFAYSSKIIKLSEIDVRDLDKIGFHEEIGYSLVSRATKYDEDLHIKQLMEEITQNEKEINDILKNHIPLRCIERVNEADEMFNYETTEIIRKLTHTDKSSALTLEALKKEFNSNTMDLIKILANDKIDYYVYVSMKKLKKIKENGISDTRILDSLKLDCDVHIDTKKLNEDAFPWNRCLMELVTDRINKFTEFRGSVTILQESIIKNNLIVVNEVENNRQDKYSGYKNILALNEIFEKTVKKIKRILDTRIQARFIRSIIDANIKREIENTEKRNIIKLLVNMPLIYCNPEESSKKYNKILDILSEIEENLTNLKNHSDLTDKLIEKKKNEILSLISFNLPCTSHIYAIKMNSIITKIIETVVDVLIDGEVQNSNYKIFDILTDITVKDKEIIQGMNLSRITRDILDFYNCFHENWYDMSEGWKSTYTNSPESYRLFNTLEDNLNSENIENYMINGIGCAKLSDFYAMFRIIHSLHKYMLNIMSYSEIWKNPAILIPTIKKDRQLAWIIYRSEKDNEVYIKEVEFTDKNLKYFRKARTPKDIEDMKGSCKKYINYTSIFMTHPYERMI